MNRKLLENWLFLVAAAHVAGGLAVPFIAYSGAFDFYLGQLAAAFWGGAAMPQEAQDFARWIIALFGPTVAGWGVLMIYLVRAGAKTRENWPWNALLLSLLVWAPADIVISLFYDFWPHVVIDACAIASIAVPVLIIRKRA
jgi:hypothetical protein